MRSVCLILIGGLLLAGCSGRPQSFTGTEHQAPRPLTSLQGKTQSQVKSKYGRPNLIRAEGDKVVWSYRKFDNCARLVYLNAQGICEYAEERGYCKN